MTRPPRKRRPDPLALGGGGPGTGEHIPASFGGPEYRRTGPRVLVEKLTRQREAALAVEPESVGQLRDVVAVGFSDVFASQRSNLLSRVGVVPAF